MPRPTSGGGANVRASGKGTRVVYQLNNRSFELEAFQNENSIELFSPWEMESSNPLRQTAVHF